MRRGGKSSLLADDPDFFGGFAFVAEFTAAGKAKKANSWGSSPEFMRVRTPISRVRCELRWKKGQRDGSCRPAPRSTMAEGEAPGCRSRERQKRWKSLAHALARYVAHQACYSLAGRDYEWELMPLGLDQGVGAVVWSPLGWARLTGKIRRGQPAPEVSRLHDGTNADAAPPLSQEHLFAVIDAIDAVAGETGKTVPQIALNWLLQRPTVSTLIIGARNEEQLTQNLGATGWTLTQDQIARLDAASATPLPYPYWHQRGFVERNPPPV